ncbi:MAG: DUF294 nucleotidyltransferase-like domain-containing protein [Solidesulfovibrio sp. DCME]|uniref:DUF294 nucleotidyltransferase-like domain-containing protein n=1 Tax=Solidesulfovibrio sp. DCME TaxID=3447380 RepID=UPI003D1055BC
MALAGLESNTRARELAEALDAVREPGQLPGLFQGIQECVAAAAGVGDALETGRLAAALHDRLLARAAALARDGPGRPPDGWCLVVLGSQGRNEQLLATDQDNLLVLPDTANGEGEGGVANGSARANGATVVGSGEGSGRADGDDRCDGAGDHGAFAAFAGRLRDILRCAGLPPCPKGIMAAAPEWRKSLGGWRDAVDAAAERPDAAGVLLVSLLADGRAVAGDARLAAALAGHVRRRVAEAPLLVRILAREAIRFAPSTPFGGHLPLGLFGFGQAPCDSKRAAVYPLVLGIKALALEAGFAQTGTVPRIEALSGRGLVGRELADRLIRAFRAVQAARLDSQARAFRQGMAVDNRLDPAQLPDTAKDGLRRALRAVGELCAILEHHFGLAYLT